MLSIVFAYSQLGHDCLKLLLEEGVEVLAVVTHCDNSNEQLWFDSVEKLALSRGITVFKPSSKQEIFSLETEFRALNPDFIFSFYYRFILSDEILSLPSLGAFNLHGSLLPKYRGRCPVNWVLINGEKETGVTLHEMVAKIDGGDIIDQEKVQILDHDTAGSLTNKLNQAAQVLLKRQIPLFKKGIINKTPQDLSKGSYFGGRTPKESEIDWTWPASKIDGLVRALQPATHYPVAFSMIDGRRINIHKVEVLMGLFPGLLPGSFENERVACGPSGEERVRLKEWQWGRE